MLPRETGLTEDDYRDGSGEPQWNAIPDALGIALSGGGTKSASFSLGVLAGLQDEGLLLPAGKAGGAPGAPSDVVVASVSGGGYAAYHLFSQLWWEHESGGIRRDLVDQAYRDCLISTFPNERVSPQLVEALAQYRCPALSSAKPVPSGEQFRLRCSQDIFLPGKCSLTENAADGAEVLTNVVLLFATSVLSLVPHNLLNTAFDSGINISPSRAIYRSGIGLTYGSATPWGQAPQTPYRPWLLNCPPEDGSGGQVNVGNPTSPPVQRCKLVTVLEDYPPAGEARVSRSAFVAPVELSFAQLRALRDNGRRQKAPFWIIQATAPQSRSLFGWYTDARRDLDNDTFEFTPRGYGSRRYGFHVGAYDGLSVLDAVVSAAAFVDSNQEAWSLGGSAGRGTFGAALHLLDLNWGIDIPNYNVSNARAAFHRILPFPLYLADSLIAEVGLGSEKAKADRVRSSFIRIMDGGNSDNTGLVALLRRGVKTIVFTDASQDTDGSFSDLCTVAENLKSRSDAKDGALKPLYLRVPALKTFDSGCLGKHWNLNAKWTSPVLLGCVSIAKDDDGCENPANVVSRLIIVKPHIAWTANEQGTRFVNEFQRSVDWSSMGAAAQQCVQEAHLVRTTAMAPKCYEATSPAECKEALPCEVLALFLRLRPEAVSLGNPPVGFPQTTTAGTTLHSGESLYAASRDLARHYTRLATPDIRTSLMGDVRAFALALKMQRDMVPLQ